MTGEPPLLDFTRLARQLRGAGTIFGVLTLAAVAGEVVGGGGIGAATLRWVSAAIAALLLTTAVLVALQAYRAADVAQRRGRRLSGRDVGLIPPRAREGRDARRDGG